MTEGVICEGGRRTRLTDVVVCSRRPSPCIYRWEREGSSMGAPQVGGILLGAPVQFASPLTITSGGGRKEEGGEKEGGG